LATQLKGGTAHTRPNGLPVYCPSWTASRASSTAMVHRLRAGCARDRPEWRVHEYSSSEFDTIRLVRTRPPAGSRPVPIGVWRCKARMS
jgi:hypothetical protein